MARLGRRGELVSYHEHNEAEAAERLAGRILGGASVALVSDAGTPGLSDPGFRLVRACRRRGLPVVVHEANARPGAANRLAARMTTHVFTAAPGVRLAHATAIGIPLRPAITGLDRPALRGVARQRFGLRPHGPVLMVTGGSQGARVMADVVPAAVAALPPELREKIIVTQQARPEDAARVAGVYERAGVKAEIAPFFNDLPLRIARAQLVIARSGASTVSELAAIGRASILVPLPHALDQDQAANAAVLQATGAAEVVRQENFTPRFLSERLASFVANPGLLKLRAEGAKAAGVADAAERLADLVLGVAQEKTQDQKETQETEI